jgi:hypothetical protein
MLLFAIPATKFYMLPIANKCRYNPLDSTRHIQDGAMLSLYYIASRIRNKNKCFGNTEGEMMQKSNPQTPRVVKK